MKRRFIDETPNHGFGHLVNRKVKAMTDENDKRGHDDRRVEVHFRHIGEAEKASFKMPENATLQATWDKAYHELKVERTDLDRLQTAGDQPKSLMGSLQVTLEQAKDTHLIKNFHFEIAAATGGA